MLTYVRTRARHLGYFTAQEAQQCDVSVMLSPACIGGFSASMALTGFAGTRCVGCAGLIDMDGYVMLWALLSKDAGAHFVEITRKVRRVLSSHPSTLFRACVRTGFKEGGRWMRIMGFSCVEKDVQLPHHAAGYRVDVYEMRKVKACQE